MNDTPTINNPLAELARQEAEFNANATIPKKPVIRQPLSMASKLVQEGINRFHAPKDPEGYPNASYPHYMPCVEHMAMRFVDGWTRQYDKPTFDRLVSILARKIAYYPDLKFMRYNDLGIIRGMVDEIEVEVLKGSVIKPEKQEETF